MQWKQNFLKDGLDYILEEITDLINFLLQFGQFLRKWKTSIVRLLIKKINSCNMCLSFQDFRPINNVNFSLEGLGESSTVTASCQIINQHRENFIAVRQSW